MLLTVVSLNNQKFDTKDLGKVKLLIFTFSKAE